MTLEPFATIENLEARWRSLDSSETTRATTLLTDASNIIRELSGDLFESPDDLTKATLEAIVCDMVRRAMMTNVDTPALNSMQTTIGPFGKSFNFTNPTGDLYLTGSEKKRLGIGRQKIGSIRPAVRGRSLQNGW